MAETHKTHCIVNKKLELLGFGQTFAENLHNLIQDSLQKSINSYKGRKIASLATGMDNMLSEMSLTGRQRNIDQFSVGDGRNLI